jgi:D-aminopeptidase
VIARLLLSLLAASSCFAQRAATDSPDGQRRRIRDLGIKVGRGVPGRYNAITDVAGVLVGQVTLSRGDGKLVVGQGPVRTGVTAILPHGGDLWREKVPAATWVLNGAGEMTGSIWVNTLGALEVPILLTNTMNVGRVMDGVVRYMLKKYPEIGVTDDVVTPVVAECDDSLLNDARGLHVSPEDAIRAIETAKSGPVEEGAVGAGTGMITYEFKAGIGTSSRVVSKEDGGWTVGALVNSNMGYSRENFTVAGVPVGREIPEMRVKAREGSIIVVLATDAPLDHLALQRLAARAAMGIARTGAVSTNGSGDLFIAFSTGNRVPHDSRMRSYRLEVLPRDRLNPLFEAAEEATEEAVLNALAMARTTVGRDGNTAYALPLERLVETMKKYGRL